MLYHNTHQLASRRGAAPWVVLIGLVVVIAAGVVVWQVTVAGADPLVIYCAHDAQFSQPIAEEFERRTGIDVEFVPDTEATKSLGLTQRILAERDNPRCDVFWNNQQLGTMDLAAEGLLEPYKGEGWQRIPDRYKAPDGAWTGFAARMRVWILNEEMLATGDAVRREKVHALIDDFSDAATEDPITAALLPELAIAKPLYGTTRTHYTVLWELWGRDRLIAWHNAWRDGGVKELQGNATVMRQVAGGHLLFGWTDTDDHFVGVDEGEPIEYAPFVINEQAIVIPNSVAIIKGTKKLEQAQQFVDFLLSKEVELMLAESKARQIPLGPLDEGDELPREVAALREWIGRGYPLHTLDEARAACLEWLTKEYGS